MYQFVVKSAFVATFVFATMSFFGASTAEAVIGSSSGRSCAEATCKTQDAVQGSNLHCRVCTVVDQGTATKPKYTRTSCRKKDSTNPTDDQLDVKASEMAKKACESAAAQEAPAEVN